MSDFNDPSDKMDRTIKKIIHLEEIIEHTGKSKGAYIGIGRRKD